MKPQFRNTAANSLSKGRRSTYRDNTTGGIPFTLLRGRLALLAYHLFIGYPVTWAIRQNGTVLHIS